MGASEERRELDNGYAFRLLSQKISLLEIAEWVTLERRCCRFFNLQIEAEPNDGPIWLRMTGAGGANAPPHREHLPRANTEDHEALSIARDRT
jgi:hypothetical protein